LNFAEVLESFSPWNLPWNHFVALANLIMDGRDCELFDVQSTTWKILVRCNASQSRAWLTPESMEGMSDSVIALYLCWSLQARAFRDLATFQLVNALLDRIPLSTEAAVPVIVVKGIMDFLAQTPQEEEASMLALGLWQILRLVGNRFG
jgi:hypothetical protein